MNRMIVSRQNQYYKMAKSLHLRKHRGKYGLFLIEGVRAVEEAVTGSFKIRFILYSEKLLQHERGRRLLDWIDDAGVSAWQVDDKLFDDVVETENSQGIIAVAETMTLQLEDLKIQKDSVILVLDGVQDPGNLGTMLRTACAAGAGAAVLMKGTTDIYNSKAVRASMGGLFHLPVVNVADTSAVCAFLKAKGFRILVADLGGEKLYYNTCLNGPVAWVLGNEAQGPDRLWLDNADEIVKIPLLGQAESLNVAVAAGILLYETIRQRKEQ
ncbi:MAG: 23S rRNA (guanosine(2251)-2'-O)-methyltransferase RlmB [Desulfitobacteriaceae bacterium]|nr:23S rRNA (guanosine(2251)-2'-O)-methyltransferase RlmB [Desulfitobacteriaceae bacterium]